MPVHWWSCVRTGKVHSTVPEHTPFPVDRLCIATKLMRHPAAAGPGFESADWVRTGDSPTGAHGLGGANGGCVKGDLHRHLCAGEVVGGLRGQRHRPVSRQGNGGAGCRADRPVTLAGRPAFRNLDGITRGHAAPGCSGNARALSGDAFGTGRSRACSAIRCAIGTVAAARVAATSRRGAAVAAATDGAAARPDAPAPGAGVDLGARCLGCGL